MPLGALEHAVQDALAAAHLPEHVHVDGTLAARKLMGDAGLFDAALDAEGDEFLVPFAAVAAVVDLGDQLAVLVVEVGIDAREGAHPRTGRPRPRALAVGDGDALAAFDQGQGFASGDAYGVERLHVWLSVAVHR